MDKAQAQKDGKMPQVTLVRFQMINGILAIYG